MNTVLSSQAKLLVTWVISNLFMPVFALIAMATLELTSRYFFFGFFMVILFLPEAALLLSKPFRIWIKDGIEDSDGKFNITDFANMLIHYAMLWCVRVFVTSFLVEILFGFHVREIYVISSFAGAFGIEAVGQILKKKKE